MPMFDPQGGQGMPVPGQGMAPQGQGGGGGGLMPPAPSAPAGARPGASVQPGPSEMALANQLYSLQQLYIQLQKQMSEMMNKPMQMHVTLHRDNDGRVAGMTATEGARK